MTFVLHAFILLQQKAMEIMGLSVEEIISVLKIVASVLKLGNISFIPSNNIDGTEGCTVSNDYGKVRSVLSTLCRMICDTI